MPTHLVATEGEEKAISKSLADAGKAEGSGLSTAGEKGRHPRDDGVQLPLLPAVWLSKEEGLALHSPPYLPRCPLSCR